MNIRPALPLEGIPTMTDERVTTDLLFKLSPFGLKNQGLSFSLSPKFKDFPQAKHHLTG